MCCSARVLRNTRCAVQLGCSRNTRCAVQLRCSRNTRCAVQLGCSRNTRCAVQLGCSRNTLFSPKQYRYLKLCSYLKKAQGISITKTKRLTLFSIRKLLFIARVIRNIHCVDKTSVFVLSDQRYVLFS
jgi:hypothetical protein